MHIALVQQLATDGFASAALEQHVVGQHQSGTPVLPEQRLHVLHEVELLVRGSGPEVVALDAIALLADPALLAHDGGTALLAEGRIGQDHVEAVAGIGGQRIAHHDGLEVLAADAVQQHVHRAQPRRGLHQLPALERLFLERPALVLGEVRVVLHHVVVRREQKAAGAAGRV